MIRSSKYSFSVAIMLTGLLVFSLPLLAGAWTQKHGDGFAKLTFSSLTSESGSQRSFRGLDYRNFSDQSLTLYGEYGVTDQLTLLVSLPFWRSIAAEKTVHGETHTVSRSSLSDADLGARLRLWQNSQWVLSAALLAGLPVADDADDEGLVFGDGELNQAVFVSLGYSAYPLPLYASMETGYNLRRGGYSDDFLLNTELGFTFRRWLIKFSGRAKFPLKNGDGQFKGGLWDLFADNQRYFAFGPEVTLNIGDNQGLSIGVETAALTRNAPSGLVLTGGYFLQW